MKIFCNNCKNNTNHEIVKEYKESYDDHTLGNECDEILLYHKWQIIRCKGCKEIAFRECWLTNYDYHPETGKPEEEEKIFPQRIEKKLSKRNFYRIPFELSIIYSEIINAFNNELYLLCAAGIRALIEGICANKKIFKGPKVVPLKNGGTKIKRNKSIEAKINGLCEKGFLTQDHAKVLHDCRFLGNKALHELKTPKIEELKIAIEILEHTINNLYVIPYKFEDFK